MHDEGTEWPEGRMPAIPGIVHRPWAIWEYMGSRPQGARRRDGVDRSSTLSTPGIGTVPRALPGRSSRPVKRVSGNGASRHLTASQAPQDSTRGELGQVKPSARPKDRC